MEYFRIKWNEKELFGINQNIWNKMEYFGIKWKKLD